MAGDIFLTLAEAGLTESKKRFVDGEDVVFLSVDEVFDDDIRLAAVRQCVACSPNEVPRFIKVQFQRNGKSKCRSLARLVIRGIPDF